MRKAIQLPFAALLCRACLVASFSAGAAAQTPGSTSGPAAPLPTAEEIVARYDQALGGREAILRHTSTTMRGTLEAHDGGNTYKLPFVYYAAKPYLRLEKVTLPGGQGEATGGFDGTTAWSLNPGGAQVTQDGDDWQSAKRDADYYYPLDELTWFKQMQTVAIEDFEGRPCYRLHGVNNWGKANDHLYDKETGLLAAYDFQSELGATHEIFSDYRQVDGVLFPFKQTVKVKSQSGTWETRQELTFESVTFNDVEPSIFALPQAVRDQLAKSAPKTGK